MKRNIRKHKSGMGIVAIAVLIVFAVIMFNRRELDSKYETLKAKESEYQKQIEKLEEEQKGIEEYKAYIESDENIENIAREKLGLVYPGDIVFEPEDE
ncbi:MAG: septum formation initiator family protein [Lachnospiraceae bacterium]|nr:septum formation initiator family protein [Lachnospiraceae bacterium]